MRYMFYRLLKLMWGNKKIYGLIVLEMAVGVTIFVVCLNIMLTNRDILHEAPENDGRIPNGNLL